MGAAALGGRAGDGWVPPGAARPDDEAAAPGAALSLPESDVPWPCRTGRASSHPAPCPALPSKDCRPGRQAAGPEAPEGRAGLLPRVFWGRRGAPCGGGALSADPVPYRGRVIAMTGNLRQPVCAHPQAPRSGPRWFCLAGSPSTALQVSGRSGAPCPPSPQPCPSVAPSPSAPSGWAPAGWPLAVIPNSSTRGRPVPTPPRFHGTSHVPGPHVSAPGPGVPRGPTLKPRPGPCRGQPLGSGQ